MRPTLVGVIAAAAGCGSVASRDADAPPAGADARPGADAARSPDAGTCTPGIILSPGADPAAQGWTVTQSGFATLSYTDPAAIQLETMPGGIDGGATLILSRRVVASGQPFGFEVIMRVDRVDTHQEWNTPVTLAGAYSGIPGTVAERDQRIYVDGGAMGWADDLGTAVANALDGAFHTYEVDVAATGQASVIRDGAAVLSRTAFTTDGTIAIGDLTSQLQLEASIAIQSVTVRCP